MLGVAKIRAEEYIDTSQYTNIKQRITKCWIKDDGENEEVMVAPFAAVKPATGGMAGEFGARLPHCGNGRLAFPELQDAR